MYTLDIAPTLLHLHNGDVSERIDGEVRTTPSTRGRSQRPAMSRASEWTWTALNRIGIQRDVTDRLRDLKHIE